MALEEVSMHAADRVPVLVRQIQSSGGLPVARDAERAAIAVLRALMVQLPAIAATESLGALLEALVSGQRDGEATPEAAVMRELGVPAERGADIARAIVVAILETLGEEAPALYAALPETLRPQSAGVSKAALARTLALGRTLAMGRPGSNGRTLADTRHASERALAAPIDDDRRARTRRAKPQRGPDRP